MAILSPSFVFGIVVLLYLSSFILFAVLRIATGISIQRIGYLSLRRLAYTPRDGIRVEIRGLGINLHRPTFAQPTWLSIVVTELAVTVDIEALETQNKQKLKNIIELGQDAAEDSDHTPEPQAAKGWSKYHGKGASESQRKSWDELKKLKERVKRLHRSIGWLRMVDIVATNSSITILEVGTIQIGSYTVAVDTRRKMVDQGHIFSRKKQQEKHQRPAEWTVTMRSVLLTAEGNESLEVLDHAALNINGLLYKEIDGLHEASIELKLGRLHIPVDDIETCLSSYRNRSKLFSRNRSETDSASDALVADFKVDTSAECDTNVENTSDFNEFLSSILRGIKEIQFAVTHIGLAKKIRNVQPGNGPLFFNASMKEVGIDVHRLDPKSPDHRMYFSSQTVAHQALLAALSVSIGVDDGHGKSDRLVYIPMTTTTIRTTLPSKIVGFKGVQSADERNANILFANIVITSPSVDLDPKHLPLLMAIMQPRPKSTSRSGQGSRELISKFLPKANVKFSMHEPVFRIALPPVEKDADEDDFDLIISSISSVSLDLESSHSAEGDIHYALASTFRVQSHDLYYQTASAARYDLLQTESMEIKVQVNASPEVNVIASGSLQTFSVRMIRPELSEGIREIVHQLRTNVEPDKKVNPKTSKDPNFIRALPPWLLHFQFHASNFSAEVAGVDGDISNDIRGVALQLESWTAEYRAHKGKIADRNPPRRRASSRSLTPDTDHHRSDSQTIEHSQDPTDGRCLTISVCGLEGFVVESAEKWEFESFLAMPQCNVTASTSTDTQGPLFHVNSHVRTLLIQYSLYRHYAIGVAATVFRKAFVRTKTNVDIIRLSLEGTRDTNGLDYLSPMQFPPNINKRNLPEHRLRLNELVTIDAKFGLIQVKANMPADPPMMLQVYGVETGRRRYSPPFLNCKLARLYVEAPKMKRVWARLASIKTGKVNLRQMRQQLASGSSVEDNVIEVSTEAIRLAVPHQVVLYKVFDNVVNTVKAIEQLHHRFKTGTNEYILKKGPEGPKHVPKISVRSKALLFEIEDGAFEWKLGNIYRSGLVEQQQRLAREEAFRVKVKKVEEQEQRKDTSRIRTRSARPFGRSNQQGASHMRSKSEEYSQKPDRSRSTTRHYRMRYDPEGLCGISASTKVPIQEAMEKLQHYNAQSWKRRIDQSYRTQMNDMKELRGGFWGPDELPDDMEDIENIVEIPQRPGLMSTLINDLHITIDKPTFPPSQLPEFLHRIGKGMPHDMKYSLLIPMHVQIDMGEARMSLRDYPLPLLHVPAMKPGQSLRLPSWSLKTNFVIAEEFCGPQSVRHVKVDIVPAKVGDHIQPNSGCFAIDVRRTVSPVKSYSDLNIDINTIFPTRITWGASYQPAIQDMMMVIENFTKPQIDPSDRTGFWDKIRLGFHSRLLVSWKGDGDVHLLLKGTRDPYAVTGNGAGFLMCWRNDVRWSVWRENDPKKFMTVESGDYILAIPDYSHQALQTISSGRDSDSVASSDSYRKGAIFKKVIMKLSGNVQWLAGLVFERNIVGGERTFDFIPHYDVILKEPAFAKAPPGDVYDAFRGFRSNYIHLSIAVTAPMNRSWSVTNTTPSTSYNSVHLTPRFFTHFFAWWSMFGGTMSLPIRQGRLWPGLEKSSKKFGRHLATIKYSILLAPLFLSHVYKHKEAEDYTEDVVSVTGLKIKLDSFMLDIHQRREWFNTQDKGRKTQSKTTGMKIHKAQLDLVSADIRAMSATIAGTTPESLKKASVPPPITQQDRGATDLSKFVIPDNDFSWIDMDDFVELDWILPAEANPHTKIMPLAYAPRLSYFRQTDHGNTIAGDPDRTSPFGNEPTHVCIMSKDDDPRKVQCQLIQNRLDQLEEQVLDHKRAMGEIELRQLQATSADDDTAIKAELDQMKSYDAVLREKRSFLEAMLHLMEARIRADIRNATPSLDLDPGTDNRTFPDEGTQSNNTRGENAAAPDFVSDFNNRFVIHNIQLKWNNSLRNTILRYIHQVSQRRGFIYYLSRRAVKFILDIVEEQNKAKAPKSKSSTPPSPQPPSASPSSGTEEQNADFDIQQRIQGLLADSKKFVDANDPGNYESGGRPSAEHLTSNIGKDFTPQNTYHVRLIAPQIQLQSEKNPKSVALVTAKGMELKLVEIMDKDRIFDEISGLVQRRFSVEMDGTQFFVTHQKLFKSPLLSLYSGSQYGTPSGSAWPPWVPMEVMFDFEVDPFGFKRVVQKTSASLRYDKYNTLRLKYNDEVDRTDKVAADSLDSRMDHLWVQFPHIRAICDSSQYYAMYIIVLDLLLYNEPLEKTRSEKLEKIMLASDFSDLRGAPEMVIRLQERIRQLEEIKTQFQIHSNYLDKKGWEGRILLDRDLTSCEDELFFMMKAITTSQRKYDGSQNNGLLRWNIASEQIVWHLMRDEDRPLMEFQLQKAEYDRTDNADGSHVNLVQIGKIVGLNLLPDAIYPEMIAPYFDPERKESESTNRQMLRVYWYMLEAIAGIPVMDHFEVNLFPMKMQLEREVGVKLFEYIFPGSGETLSGNIKGSAARMKNMAPPQDEDDEEDNSTTHTTQFVLNPDADRSDANTGSGADSLELRLRPTLNSESRSKTGLSRKKARMVTLHHTQGSEGASFRLFQSNKAHASDQQSTKSIRKKPSVDSLGSSNATRPTISRSMTTFSAFEGSVTSEKRNKLFAINRSGRQDDVKPSDDLTKMLNRASNYMTLAYVKIPSVVICLSYKGKDQRNIEDLHDFVFRLPMLEYRNKTWSNLDLALALKKDVIRALISHTGAIIGNKFTKSRPTMAQQHRLRELATSNVLLVPSRQDSPHDFTDTGSTLASSPTDARDRSKSPRRSFASNSSSLRPVSAGSSGAASFQSRNRGGSSIPQSLTMTKSHPSSGEGGSQTRYSGDSYSFQGSGNSDKHKGGFLKGAIGRRLQAIGGRRRRDRPNDAPSGSSGLEQDEGYSDSESLKHNQE
ncbi:hypothetical protein V501_02180 [Pseudogymnoascus sp. VKM F-4519 (FW-2642)]|nr:hypothetical protein V501_02180 [Pseudogymnoascus sp. VKM F-4519 (FW-2642)]